MSEDWQNGGFGLYVHWPFCEAKCPYCDFNSHVVRSIDHDSWRTAYQHELDRAAMRTSGRVLNSIFFGGGTPSLMEPETVAAVIESARSHWRFANDIEITLEANPGSVDSARFAAYARAGVNRISLGVQALNDADLKRLGRIHSLSEAMAAIYIARTNFDRVSFDLIYARQDQSLADWEHELTQALGLATDHLSLYQLTIEDGTAFGDRFAAGKLKGLPVEDLSADMYLLTQQICDSHGMARYEVSNHARTGQESRHNLIYWRSGDYVGIGPGAHGRLTIDGARIATEQIRNPSAWLNATARDSTSEVLARSDRGEEFLMMGLRLVEGIDASRYEDISGQRLDPAALDELSELGLITHQGDRISISDQGFMVLNGIISRLALA